MSTLHEQLKLDELEKIARPYHVLVALRGPDHGMRNEMLVLKSTVTARLRAIVFHGSATMGLYVSVPFAMNDYIVFVEACASLCQSKNTEWAHFVEHLFAAVNEVQEHVIWNGFGDKMTRVLWYTSNLQGDAVTKELHQAYDAQQDALPTYHTTHITSGKETDSDGKPGDPQ